MSCWRIEAKALLNHVAEVGQVRQTLESELILDGRAVQLLEFGASPLKAFPIGHEVEEGVLGGVLSCLRPSNHQV